MTVLLRELDLPRRRYGIGSLHSARRGLSELAFPPLLRLALIFTTVQKGPPLQAFPGDVFFTYMEKDKPGFPSKPAGPAAVISTWWGKQVPPHCSISPSDPAPSASSPSMPYST